MGSVINAYIDEVNKINMTLSNGSFVEKHALENLSLDAYYCEINAYIGYVNEVNKQRDEAENRKRRSS